MILLELFEGPHAWETRAVPGGFDEVASTQFKAIPGIRWKNGAFLGDSVAIEAAAKILEAAEVAAVEDHREQEISSLPEVFAPEQIFSFQKEGASRVLSILKSSGSALLCDEMGLGKTLQAIVTADNLLQGSEPILVVTPAVVVPHFEKEIRRWARDPSRFRVTSYARLHAISKGGNKNNLPLDPATALIVFDEIHNLSNCRGDWDTKGSLRARAARKIVRELPKRPFLLGLSGTLMTARIRDLFNPLDFLWPFRFGGWQGFTKRYCNGHYEEIQGVEQAVWNTDGSSHLEELHARLQSCIVRRIKSEVSLQLPELSRELIEVEISRKAQKDLSKALAAIASDKVSISSLLSDVEAYKIEAAVELAEEIKAQGGSPLILTTRIASALEIGRRLACPTVTGEVPKELREGMFAGASMGTATIYSIGIGVNLSQFDSVIFVGLDWLPSTLLQAEARAHRIGQRRNVIIYYLIGTGTVDEVVRERVLKRLDEFGKVIGDGSDGLRESFAGPSEAESISAMVERMRK